VINELKSSKAPKILKKGIKDKKGKKRGKDKVFSNKNCCDKILTRVQHVRKINRASCGSRDLLQTSARVANNSKDIQLLTDYRPVKNSIISCNMSMIKDSELRRIVDASRLNFSNLFSNFKYEYFVAGISGGVASTLILHPLDLMKIRFAVNDGCTNATRYNNLRSAFTDIVKTEGLRGLYKGVMPNILCSGSSWGFYFFFYNTIKNFIHDGNSKKPLGASMHMFAAANAGVLSLLMTNPISVVKTRFCLQYTNDVNTAESKKYHGIADALMKIYKIEGIKGFYKGLIPGFFGVSHGAIQFMVYEEMKNNYYSYLNLSIDTKLSSSEYICFAVISKLCASVTTYPYQVVRTRLQDHHHNYCGTWDCIQTMWKSEGIKGFYKGLSPYLLHVTPNICIVFLVYEHFTNDR